MEMEIEMAPAAFWYFIVFGVAVYWLNPPRWMQVQKLERWGRENPEAINNLLIRSSQLLRQKAHKSI